MAEKIHDFYESLADYYHLIFEDWDRAIERQAMILGELLSTQFPSHPLKILDCACGIGTQAIGFAAMGHSVTASDLSSAAVDRARKEARQRGLSIAFHVSNLTSLKEIADSEFDLAVALDNALPHLSAGELRQAASAIASKLKRGGVFIASIRDYDKIVLEKPQAQVPAFYGTDPNRRIVHQVWDWVAEDRYVLHLCITVQSDRGWTAHHFVSEYRCLLRDELSSVLRDAGFTDIRWLMAAESGFYQPLVLATLSSCGR